MPWSSPTVSELRTAFVHAVRTARQPVAQAARDFGISRKTAYKWLDRFDRQLPLHDQARTPHRSPTRTPPELEAAVLAVRDRFGWGPRKIAAYLTNHRQPSVPARTAAAILRRQGRVKPPPPPTPAPQRFERDHPNQLWQLDFKGYAEVARQKVYPLTILDDHSRFLLALRPCLDVTMATAWTVLWATLGEYGLPDELLCDNAFGPPGSALRGVSWFEARLLRLGIRPLHGRPYHPQTQGKVERLHGTLMREVYPRLDTSSVATFTAGLDSWRLHIYNSTRPHEAVADQPPITRWRPSRRRRPAELPAVEYPPGSVIRRVGSNGLFHYRRGRILAGQGLAGEPVRVEETDQCVVVWYAAHEIRRIPLARLDESGIL